MSSSVFALQVSPTVPAELQRLHDLAGNFWFSWNPALGQLFRKLDPILWRKVEGSPRRFLRSVDQSILDAAATDPAFIDDYRSILASFDKYLGGNRAPVEGLEAGDLIAYFCAEYGWHESFPIYSGGLGVLAGDHCKTASDLGLPFVAVGLLYRHGYFSQRIDGAGQQQPSYPPIDPRSAPLGVALNPDGSEVRVSCPALDRTVAVRIWKAAVGRVTVLLLDTDVPENVAEDRQITARLYGGTPELRQQQEAVLGIGGVRALRALGLEPTDLAHQRGACGVHDPGADSRVREGRSAVCGCARSHRVEHRVHDAHARQRRPRRISARTDRCAVRELSCRDRRHDGAIARPRPRSRAGRRLQHDAARVARRGGRQRRQQDSRSGVGAFVRERVARCAAAGESRRLRDQRRARIDVLAAHVDESVRSARRPGLARPHDGSCADGAHRGHSRRGVLGHEPEGQESDAARAARAAHGSNISATA